MQLRELNHPAFMYIKLWYNSGHYNKNSKYTASVHYATEMYSILLTTSTSLFTVS